MDSPSRQHRLCVLGSPRLVKPDGTNARSVLAQPKRVALLSFLRLAADGGAVSRDAVLGTFWPEVPEERALNALRQGVHFLRRSLGADAIEREEEHRLRVPAERVWCDVAEFERRLAEGDAEGAMALYGGPFLEGLPIDGPHELEDWIERRRAALRREAAEALHALGAEALRDGRAIAGVDWARRLVDLDPLEERGVALLVEAHAAEGDLVAAVRAYESYAERLEAALDLRPSAELETRLRALRAGADGRSAEAGVPGAPAGEGRGQGAVAASVGVSSSPSPGEARSGWVDGLRRSPLALGGLAIAVGAIIALATGIGRRSEPGPAPAAGAAAARPSVAVLPFEDRSPDSTTAFFTSGMHESVLVTLSRIAALDVIGLQAVRGYAETTLSPTEIAEELGVTALVFGSVQREPGRARIIVELVDPRTGSQLWSDLYDRRLDDVFGVQSDIATNVAASLQAVLTPVEVERIARAPTSDVEALDAYMRGREAYDRLSPESMEEALRQYREAVAVDPDFAAAWAGIADALLQQVQFYGAPLTLADSATTLVERAIRLDPDLPEAHKTLGFIHSVFGRQRASLEASLRALELRPAFPDADNNAAWSLYYLGDMAEATRRIERAFRLQPTLLLLRSNVGAVWAAAGRADVAQQWLDAVLALDPSITATRDWRVFVEYVRGDTGRALDLALAYVEDEESRQAAHARAAYAALLARDFGTAREHATRVAREAEGADLFTLRRVETTMGYALLRTGEREEGERFLRAGLGAVSRMVANGADGWDPPWEMAAAHAALGDGPEALRHLATAVERGFPHAELLHLEPTFDVVRDDPTFRTLVERVEVRAAEQLGDGLASTTVGPEASSR